MSEFKVGDRVRIREDLKDDEEYYGTSVINAMLDYRGKIATIKSVQGVFYSIDLDEQTWAWTKEMFEGFGKEVIAEFILNDRLETKVEVKTTVEIKLENLEQRIEKLEKCVMGEQNSLEKCANVSSMSKNGLLTEDEKVILRNLPKKYKWIARDEDEELLYAYEEKPSKDNGFWRDYKGENWGSLSLFNHLFRFIKFEDDEPYNIEELLKEGNKE